MSKRFLGGRDIAVLEPAIDELLATGPGRKSEAIRPWHRERTPGPAGEPWRRISRAPNPAGAGADPAVVRR